MTRTDATQGEAARVERRGDTDVLVFADGSCHPASPWEAKWFSEREELLERVARAEEALTEAFLAGVASTGEGLNGEYPVEAECEPDRFREKWIDGARTYAKEATL